MTLTLDDDWRLFDGVEVVTLTPRNPAGTPIAGVKALRGVLDQPELSALAALGVEPTDVVWNLWRSTLSAAVPYPGDTITDSVGEVWIILSQSLRTLGTRWRAVCRRER